MALHILTESPEPTTMTLILEGHLDAVTSPDLERFTSHLGTEVKTLVFDLGKLSYISSAGLRIFAKARKTMHSREGKVCFVNLSPQVQKVFDIVKVVPYEDIFRNDEELDAYLEMMQRKVSEDDMG